MLEILGSVWNLICRLISLLFVVIVGPTVLLIFLPIYFIRWIVSILAWAFRPDLGSIMDVRSTLFGTELVHDQGNDIPTTNFVPTYVFQGTLTREIALGFCEKVVKLRNEDGALKYPELRQFPYKWLGFVFWKWVDNWDLKNHIKYISVDPNSGSIVEGPLPHSWEVTPKELRDIERELIKRKWKDNMSPWEFWIVHNYRPKDAKDGVQYSVGLVKGHHSLADGYSISKMFLLDILGLPPSSQFTPNFKKKSKVESLFQKLYVFLRIPFDLVGMFLTKPDVNPWHLPPKRSCGSAKMFTATSDRIPLRYLKDIKNSHGVGFMSLLFSAYAGGIRKTMLKRNETVPEVARSLVPFPMIGHPNRLTNYWSGILLDFHVGIDDPVQRLKATHEYLRSLKHSTTPLTSFILQPLLGGLFDRMIKSIARVPIPTAIASDFPGPSTILSIGDNIICEDAYFSAAFPPRKPSPGVLFFSASYAGGWKLKVQVDGGIMNSDEEAEALVEAIVSEISQLHKSIQV